LYIQNKYLSIENNNIGLNDIYSPNRIYAGAVGISYQNNNANINTLIENNVVNISGDIKLNMPYWFFHSSNIDFKNNFMINNMNETMEYGIFLGNVSDSNFEKNRALNNFSHYITSCEIWNDFWNETYFSKNNSYKDNYFVLDCMPITKQERMILISNIFINAVLIFGFLIIVLYIFIWAKNKE